MICTNPPPRSWLSRDPIGEADGPAIYVFVRNNPVNSIDPIGLKKNTPICKATLIMLHGDDQGGPRPIGTDVDPPVVAVANPSERFGYFGCYSDKYNHSVPEQVRMNGMPSVPADQQWPPPDRRQSHPGPVGAFNEDVCKSGLLQKTKPH